MDTSQKDNWSEMENHNRIEQKQPVSAAWLMEELGITKDQYEFCENGVFDIAATFRKLGQKDKDFIFAVFMQVCRLRERVEVLEEMSE